MQSPVPALTASACTPVAASYDGQYSDMACWVNYSPEHAEAGPWRAIGYRSRTGSARSRRPSTPQHSLLRRANKVTSSSGTQCDGAEAGKACGCGEEADRCHETDRAGVQAEG